jgi:hypothetical protein
MEAVITYFILNIKEYQHRTCKANAQAQNIDQGIDLVTKKVPESDLKIIL